VWTHWRLLSSDAVEVSGQKRTVARPQLGNSDALASGPAKYLVCLRVGFSGEGAFDSSLHFPDVLLFVPFLTSGSQGISYR